MEELSETLANSGVSTRNGKPVDGLVGRELDAEVARRVMELEVWVDVKYGGSGARVVLSNALHYSSAIAAAMEVVEKMESLNYQWQFSRTAPVKSMHDNKPHAQFWTYKVGVLQPIGMATADTLPEAICLAALAAVGEQATPMS